MSRVFGTLDTSCDSSFLSFDASLYIRKKRNRSTSRCCLERSGSRGRLPALSSHATVRTVPYTAVHERHSALRATCRKRLTLVSRYLGGSAAYLPGAIGPLSPPVCISLIRRSQRHKLGSLVFDPSSPCAVTTTVSADFCPSIATPRDPASLSADGQTSQGKTRDLHPTYPPHLRPPGPGGIGLWVSWPPRPPDGRLLCGSCASGQDFASSFLQTPPHGGCPCCSARSSRHQGLRRDLHPPSHFPLRFP